MMTFDRINRRAHLYLGLILLPWVMMYGISSFIISHHAWFRADTEPPWKPVFERDYRHPVPEHGDWRAVAADILRENGLIGAFYAQQPNPDELRIDRFSFFSQIRLTYRIKEGKLRAEKQALRWDQVILRMHFRGGYDQPKFLNWLWAILVDTTCAAILIWILSGLVMWWRLARTRVWGVVALGAGAVSFLILIWKI